MEGLEPKELRFLCALGNLIYRDVAALVVIECFWMTARSGGYALILQCPYVEYRF